MSIDLTFIGQIVVFLVFLGLMKKYLYGPLSDLMEQRSVKIAEGLAAADAGKEARAKAKAEIATQLKEARGKAQEILTASEKRAAEIEEEITTRARSDAQQIVDAARDEVGAEINKARQALRKEVADIAMLAAERVLEVELSGQRHAKLIGDVISKEIGHA
ncbi:MAG: F0F1 ATP synthase subunit B [Mariprofundaceae bacterium]|nr:F0F1 ATP synthase subunit B [Mariprofundaceae bacterium]